MDAQIGAVQRITDQLVGVVRVELQCLSAGREQLADLISRCVESNDIRRALSESPTSTNFQTYYLTFAAIPVPAAVWLFGSALGLMGLARRRKTASAGHRRVQHASREG